METDLGAYVLDALEPDESDLLERHLDGCPVCQAELSSLAATVSWLALLDPTEVAELTQEDTAPPRRRRRLVTAVASVGLAASVALGAGVALDRSPAPPAGAAVVRAVDPATHVTAAVAMSTHRSGTELRLTLTGAYPNGWCSLVARSRDGQREVAATWVADPDGTAVVSGQTAIPRDQLSELEVVTDRGQVLVHLPVPAHNT